MGTNEEVKAAISLTKDDLMEFTDMTEVTFVNEMVLAVCGVEAGLLMGEIGKLEEYFKFPVNFYKPGFYFKKKKDYAKFMETEEDYTEEEKKVMAICEANKKDYLHIRLQDLATITCLTIEKVLDAIKKLTENEMLEAHVDIRKMEVVFRTIGIGFALSNSGCEHDDPNWEE